MKLLRICIITVFVFCLGPLKTQSTSPDFDSLFAEKLQEKLTELGLEEDYQGLSAAVLVPGQGIWTGAYGFAAPGEPMETNMRLGIASNSKSITAGLILKLQEAGLLQLDDPISNYLPAYPQVDGTITIRQLLNHSTGLFDFINDWSSATQAAYAANDDRIWTLTDLVNTLGAPNYPVGERYDYSNTNFLLAGMVAEAAGGASLGELYHQYLFSPLDLEMAYPPYDDVFDQPFANLWNTAGNSVSLDDDGSRTFLTFPASAGAIWSTPHDMVRWYAALFGPDWLGSQEKADVRYRDGYIAYTTGVRVRNDFDHSFYYHAGAWGFRSYLLYDPRTGVSVAVVSNQYGTSVTSTALDLFAETLAEMPTPQRDARLVDVIPAGTSCLVEAPLVIVKNEGLETITSMELAIGLDGVWQDTLPLDLAGGLAFGEQIFQEIPFSLEASDGIKKELNMELIFADDVPNNNYREAAFMLEDGTGQGLPYVEDFESSLALPNSLISRQSDNLLDWGITQFAAANGEHSLARINYYDGNIGDHYAFDLPLLHINEQGAMLSFNYAHTVYPGVGREDLRAYISTNCGLSYTLLFELLDSELVTAPQSTDLFLPTPDQWANYQIDLGTYAGEDVLIRFELENEFGNITYLDDLRVDVPTAIQEISAQTFKISPNPAGGQINIHLPNNFEAINCEIIDSYGRVLQSQSIENVQTSLVVQRGTLPAGVYFVRLRNSKGWQMKERVVFY